MAASIATALKQLIEGAGLGLHAYRDQLSVDAKSNLPAVAIQDRITVAVEPRGADDDDDTATEQVQMWLWERYIDESDPDAPVLAESYSLADDLARAIHKKPLPMAPKHVYGVYVRGVFRSAPDREANLVGTRFAIDVKRQLF